MDSYAILVWGSIKIDFDAAFMLLSNNSNW